jgi:hypothetical protein
MNNKEFVELLKKRSDVFNSIRENECELEFYVNYDLSGDFNIYFQADSDLTYEEQFYDYVDNYDVDEEFDIYYAGAKDYGLTARELINELQDYEKILEKAKDVIKNETK